MQSSFRRFATSLALCVSLTAPIEAHTLAVILTKTQAPENSKATVYMAWGHLLPVDELVNAEDIASYRVHGPSGETKDLKLDPRSLQANEVVFEKSGVHQVEASRKTGVFTFVKKGDGKTAFMRVPKSEVKLEPGSTIVRSMRSQMYAKAIAICGEAGEKPAAALGHRLEIVPVTAPKNFLIDKPITMKVISDGKPLADAAVQIACLRTHSDGTSTTQAKTDANGQFEFTPAETGLWMISVNHSEKATGEDAKSFDTDSFVATLTLGIEDVVK